MTAQRNLIIYGENIRALKYLLEERGLKGKVDLIYTDPPFATNITFTVTDGRSCLCIKRMELMNLASCLIN